MRQYKREINVILGGDSLHSSKFDIEFDIEFTDDSKLNHAEIVLYNLAPNRINNIRKGTPVIVQAGYEKDVGAIFMGAVYEAKTVREGVDRKTTIKAVDATDQVSKLKVNKTYQAGTRASQIIRDLAGLSGLSLGALSLPRDIVYRSGKTVQGSIIKNLKRLAQDVGAKFHISNQKIYIRGGKEGDNIQFLFNADRGLIGTPEPFVEEDDKGKEIRGYKVLGLLQHRIRADAIITVESSIIKGQYRVRKGRHYGSNFGQDFYTEMEVV